MRETLKYTNYHEFHTSIRVIYQGQDITGNPQKTPPAGQTPTSQTQPPTPQTPAKPQ